MKGILTGLFPVKNAIIPYIIINLIVEPSKVSFLLIAFFSRLLRTRTNIMKTNENTRNNGSWGMNIEEVNHKANAIKYNRSSVV